MSNMINIMKFYFCSLMTSAIFSLSPYLKVAKDKFNHFPFYFIQIVAGKNKRLLKK